ncbi:MAG: MFS transporter [Candidatus Aquirickettsiella sp.]
MKIATSNTLWCQQTRYIIFGQLIIIAMLDMSDPYWPLILSSYHSFDARTLQYWSGVIYMAPLLTTIFTTLLWTKIGGRIGYKKMILRAGFALAASQWTLIFFKNPWWILLIRLLQGALAGFTAAAQAWSLKITPINAHSRIVGRLQSATALGSIVGPICGGILANYYGYSAIFMTSGFVCVLVSALLANFLIENPINKENKKIIIQKIKKFYPGENLLLFLICFTQAARWMSTPFFALYVVEQLHSGNIAVGIIYALIALTMSLTTPNLGRFIDKQNNFVWGKRILVMALLLGGLVYCGYAFVTKAYLAFILSLFLGISLGASSLILFTFLLKGITENRRSQLVGLGNTALKLGNLLGIIMGSTIQAGGRFMISFIFIAFFYFFLAVLSLRYN